LREIVALCASQYVLKTGYFLASEYTAILTVTSRQRLTSIEQSGGVILTYPFQ
jgi:hypothetical protein